MKNTFIFLLGIVTGIILTKAVTFFTDRSDNPKTVGLETFEEPGDCIEYSRFTIQKVVESGFALAKTYDDNIFLIVPNENHKFYDGQRIDIKNGQCALHIGFYRYKSKIGRKKTVPAVKITDNVKSTVNNRADDEKILFDKPGDCVSWKNFEVQKVLESGDVIALEIKDMYSGYVSTSDLEVLIPAQGNGSFYEKQIIKAPKGKCARQIGIYKYKKYGDFKVIPIIAFK